jgi:hypothetical protein
VNIYRVGNIFNINNNMTTVYRFKRKIGSDWKHILDKDGIPLAITTNKGRQAILHIFKHRYPSIAAMYRLGETLIAEPDLEATKRLEELRKKMAEKEEERASSGWWHNY